MYVVCGTVTTEQLRLFAIYQQLQSLLFMSLFKRDKNTFLIWLLMLKSVIMVISNDSICDDSQRSKN